MIRAQFRFLAYYPVMAFICGAILFMLTGAIMKSMNLKGGDLLIISSILFVSLGVIFQILYLMARYRRTFR